MADEDSAHTKAVAAHFMTGALQEELSAIAATDDEAVTWEEALALREKVELHEATGNGISLILQTIARREKLVKIRHDLLNNHNDPKRLVGKAAFKELQVAERKEKLIKTELPSLTVALRKRLEEYATHFGAPFVLKKASNDGSDGSSSGAPATGTGVPYLQLLEASEAKYEEEHASRVKGRQRPKSSKASKVHSAAYKPSAVAAHAAERRAANGSSSSSSRIGSKVPSSRVQRPARPPPPGRATAAAAAAAAMASAAAKKPTSRIPSSRIPSSRIPSSRIPSSRIPSGPPPQPPQPSSSSSSSSIPRGKPPPSSSSSSSSGAPLPLHQLPRGPPPPPAAATTAPLAPHNLPRGPPPPPPSSRSR